MPARKGSIDGNFATKAINYIKQYTKPALAITGVLGFVYLHNGCNTNAWTYKQITEYNHNQKIEKKKELEKQERIKKEYNALFNGCKTREDTLKVIVNNPVLSKKIRIKYISPQDMEEAVKQSKLERGLK